MSGLEEFRSRVEAFLGARYPRRPEMLRHGQGDDSLVGAAFRDSDDEVGDLQRARDYQRELFDAGLAWLGGPVEYGGAGLGAEERRAFAEIVRRYDVPDVNGLLVGQQIIAPAILAHGSAGQRARLLPALWSGELVGCQLFSEPGAGSDLASLRTRARRTDGGWRVDGQKVWSSGAHLAHVGELLARTSPDPASRTRGLTMFLLGMDSLGVTVRPLRQMTGTAHFCEVFLDDVFVPDDAVLGEVGGGWAVANVSLNSERDNFGDEGANLFIRLLDRLVLLGQEIGATEDPDVRDRLADGYIRHVIGQVLPASLENAVPEVAAAGASLVKLFATDADRRLAQLALDILGPALVADTGAWGTYAWSRVLLGIHATRIAGGTDEIQRNILAERALGLPREARSFQGGR
ncbi:Acyl-CoA dehydrogenase [Thermomonospora echinospora]|uniref:Acyl-CoA dehydrogenase n=1 Tax=Thermomonospora echinospora TaxID=1992 RepID=A0A1H6E3I6_9ACTN|nr:acyl-CoA dehydrogenase family protein [Thermomonospora echinospora]SEG91859.1 Acyl-CoA dehydrogenase [Thermomonospora echinospora]